MPPVSPPFTIGTPLSNLWIKALIYGPYGGGKTTLAASSMEVPEMGDVLFIDAESGTMSLLDWPDLSVIRINSYSQFARIHEWLRKHCRARDEDDEEALKKLEGFIGFENPGKAKRFRTVIMDSISEIQQLNMYQLLDINIGDSAIDEIPTAPEFAHWNRTTHMLRRLVREMRDLPINFICVSSEKEEDGYIGINFPKQLRNDLPGFFDIVGYLEARQITDPNDSKRKITQRRLNLVRTSRYVAKHRFGRAMGNETFVDDPSMKMLYDLQQESLGRAA